MKWLLPFLFLASQAYAAGYAKVAILDSGLDLHDSRFQSDLCSSGHKDFTGTGIQDNFGHGTHVAGLVKTYARDANYCLVILKYWDPKIDGTNATGRDLVRAYTYAAALGVDVVVVAGGGPEKMTGEEHVISQYTKIKFVVAAGNDGKSLDSLEYSFYPASYGYANELVVGALTKKGHKLSYSNYGQGVVWELGEHVLSTKPNGKYGYMSGSSMATGIGAGKYIYENYR